MCTCVWRIVTPRENISQFPQSIRSTVVLPSCQEVNTTVLSSHQLLGRNDN